MHQTTRRRLLPLAAAIPIAGLAISSLVAAPGHASAATAPATHQSAASRLASFAAASGPVVVKDIELLGSANATPTGLRSLSKSAAEHSFDK